MRARTTGKVRVNCKNWLAANRNRWCVSRMDRFSAVIFDMDGLMLDTEVIGKRSWEKSAEKLGIQLPIDYYPRVIGRTTVSIRPMLLEWFGNDFPVDAFIEGSNQFYQETIHSAPPPVKPGLKDLLLALNAAGIPCGVATSTKKQSAVHKLTSTGLIDHFKILTTGDEVENSKPAPDIYLLAAKRLGSPPGECLALEDSPAGIRAAKSSGMTVFMVPDMVPPTQEIAAIVDGIFENLSEVHRWLVSHNLL